MAVNRNKPKLIIWAPELHLLRDARRIAAPQYDVVATTVPARALALLQREPLAAAILCEHVAATGKGKDKSASGASTTAIALLEAARLRRPDARRILLIQPDDAGLSTRLLHHGAVEAVLHMPLTRKELFAALRAPRVAADAGGALRASA